MLASRSCLSEYFASALATAPPVFLQPPTLPSPSLQVPSMCEMFAFPRGAAAVVGKPDMEGTSGKAGVDYSMFGMISEDSAMSVARISWLLYAFQPYHVLLYCLDAHATPALSERPCDVYLQLRPLLHVDAPHREQ